MPDSIIQLNQDLIHNELKDLVRNSVEETLNALLDHEVGELVNAEKCERSSEFLKHSLGGEIQNVSILVAIGVGKDGCREIIGAAEGMKEDKESWRSFFVALKERRKTPRNEIDESGRKIGVRIPDNNFSAPRS